MSLIPVIQALSTKAKSEPTTKRYLFYYTGESNSGGQGRNTSATTEELAVTSKVQILNNTSFVFQDLKMTGNVSQGKNNQIDHYGVDQNVAWHGLELQQVVRANDFNFPFLVKCGQGGSIISQWNDGGTYDLKMKERASAAQSLLSGMGINPEVNVFLTLGINDMIAGTNTTTWYNGLINWIGRVKTITQAKNIYITTFDDVAGMTDFNTKIRDAVAAFDYLHEIDTSGYTFVNIYHWDYVGLKSIANNMFDQIL